VRTLRRTLGEGGDRPFIRTVSRHGYQFVCLVAEVEDAGEDAVPGTGKAAVVPAVPPGAPDPSAAALGRLLDPAATNETRRDATEELHTLDTAEALRHLDRRPGHAKTWTHLRDSRWTWRSGGSAAPGRPGRAGLGRLARLRVGGRCARPDPLGRCGGRGRCGRFGRPPGGLRCGLGGSSALAPARWLVGASADWARPGWGGLAAAEVLVRSWRFAVFVLFGVVSGGLVGLVARCAACFLLDTLFGLGQPSIGGGWEGVCLGAAAGVGYGLATRRMVDGAPAFCGRARFAMSRRPQWPVFWPAP
jgi:hypothetical protein